MEALLDAWKNFDYLNLLGGIPFVKIVLAFAILAIAQFFRKLISNIVVTFIERLTAKTETTIDDELIAIIKPAINLVILVFGFWLAQAILAEELGPQLSANIDKIINFVIIIIVGYVVFRAASLLGRVMANSVLKTETELDDLLRPFLPKIFQAVAIMAIVIKASEIFLGASAGALVGLLGGAGLTIGLLFKDIVYDWFCTVVIYTDHLFKEGDWIRLAEIEGLVQVVEIGFRSTTLKIMSWDSVLKLPNSQMITGIVQNWSQPIGKEPLKWGLNCTLKIDGISADKTAKVCQSIRDSISTIKGMSSKYLVRFTHIEENARVIAIRAFVEDQKLYFVNEEKLNLAVLRVLEQEGIDTLYVHLRTEPESYKKSLAAVNN
ncbi:MAG: mechanosensitive ion channel domain-containing protein [Cyanobacteria bacterium P01_A01_bin.83]